MVGIVIVALLACVTVCEAGRPGRYAECGRYSDKNGEYSAGNYNKALGTRPNSVSRYVMRAGFNSGQLYRNDNPKQAASYTTDPVTRTGTITYPAIDNVGVNGASMKLDRAGVGWGGIKWGNAGGAALGDSSGCSFSIMAWVYFDTGGSESPTEATIFSHNSFTASTKRTTRLYLSGAGGYVKFLARDNSLVAHTVEANTVGYSVLNNWKFCTLVVTRSRTPSANADTGSTLKIYIDQTLVRTSTLGLMKYIGLNSVYAGKVSGTFNPSLPSTSWHGWIDEFRYFWQSSIGPSAYYNGFPQSVVTEVYLKEKICLKQ